MHGFLRQIDERAHVARRKLAHVDLRHLLGAQLEQLEGSAISCP